MSTKFKSTILLVFLQIFLVKGIHEDLIYIRKDMTTGQTTYYMINDNYFNFFESRSFCENQGWTLPVIETQDDMNYLMDTLVYKNMVGVKIWIGILQVDNKCDKWLDGSPVKYKLPWHSTSCRECMQSCCAVFLWNDFNHKKADVMPCNQRARRVCMTNGLMIGKHVTQDQLERRIQEVTHDINEDNLKMNSSIFIIWVWNWNPSDEKSMNH